MYSRKSPLALSLLIGLAAWCWQGIDGSPASPLLAIFILVSQWLAITAGYFILRCFSPQQCNPWRDFDALVTGNIALGFVLLLLVYFAQLDATWAFAITSALIVAGGHLFPDSLSSSDQPLEWHAIGVLLISIAIATFLSMDALQPFIVGEQSVIFKPWSDLFIHSANTMMMASGDEVAAGRFEAAGEPAKFYHYGSYMLPALLFGSGLAEGLDVTTAFWSPFGLLLLCLALFSLARLLWGGTIALLAMALVMLLPDASFQFFKPVYFSFEWLLQASPGCAWGLAIFCLALKFMLEGISRDQRGLCVLALCGTAMLLFFRAQFAIVGGSFMLLVFLLYERKLTGFQRLLIGGVFMVTAGLALKLLGSRISNPTLIGPPGGSEFITFFLSPLYNSPLLGMETPLPPATHTGLWIAGATAALMLSIHGISLFLYPLALAVLKRCQIQQPFAMVPVIFVLVYLVQAWIMPKNSGGNLFELQHRPFLISYLLLLLWTIGSSLRVASQAIPRPLPATAKAVFCSAMVLLLIGLQLQLPTVSGVAGREQQGAAFPRGLYEVARELNRAHNGSERFLHSQLDPSEFIIALADTRSFLSRPQRHSIETNPKRRALYADLTLRARNILLAQDLRSLRELGEREGVRWLIVGPDDTGVWRNLTPVFSDRGFTLYDFSENTEQNQDSPPKYTAK